jgi:hypothetical protein
MSEWTIYQQLGPLQTYLIYDQYCCEEHEMHMSVRITVRRLLIIKLLNVFYVNLFFGIYNKTVSLILLLTVQHILQIRRLTEKY